MQDSAIRIHGLEFECFGGKMSHRIGPGLIVEALRKFYEGLRFARRWHEQIFQPKGDPAKRESQDIDSGLRIDDCWFGVQRLGLGAYGASGEPLSRGRIR